MSTEVSRGVAMKRRRSGPFALFAWRLGSVEVFAYTLVAAATLLLASLALVGLRYLTRGTPVAEVSGVEGNRDLPRTDDESFGRTIELLTHSDLEFGNHATLCLNGDGTYDQLFRDLESARDTITLQLYYCHPGKLADRFGDVLRERAKAGVRVMFLLDAFGSAPLAEEYLESLAAAGVEIAKFRPVRWYALEKAYARSHIRVVVVDGRVAYTGGFGMDDKWLGNGRHEDQWRETNVRFTGPAVLQLQAGPRRPASCWRVTRYFRRHPPMVRITNQCARQSSMPRRRSAAQRRSVSSPCRSRVRGAHSTSRTRTLYRTMTS